MLRGSVSFAFAAALTLSASVLAGPAGFPPVPQPIPAPPFVSPYLFVKVLPPAGSKVTWSPQTTESATFAEPTVVGLRPGYRYRLELNNLPGTGLKALHPSIEVRSTLHAPMGMEVEKHPLPLTITDNEVAKIARGAMVTKIFLLEDPDRALSITSKPDEPLESLAISEAEAIKEIKGRGRIMLIVRIGERLLNPDELARETVPGTVLLPGGRPSMPSLPPCLPLSAIPLFDPISGPRFSDFECLHDGGDEKLRLGIGTGGKLGGLDPSDTALEYTGPKGRKVATSNKVCICVPRFLVYRIDSGLAQDYIYRGTGADVGRQGLVLAELKLKPKVDRNTEMLARLDGNQRPSATQGAQGIITIDKFAGLKVVATVQGVKAVVQVSEPEDITVYPKCQLMLQKWVEPRIPTKIGEEVTFSLRYTNTTTAPLTDLVVSDSLTARLEYISGSEKHDRAATMTATENEAGSLTLRWAIAGKLLPGETGFITFRARIR